MAKVSFGYATTGLPVDPRTRCAPAPDLLFFASSAGGALLLLPTRLRIALQISLRLCFVLQRHRFVRIDPHHQVSNVIVDLGEQMPYARRNHDRITRL